VNHLELKKSELKEQWDRSPKFKARWKNEMIAVKRQRLESVKDDLLFGISVGDGGVVAFVVVGVVSLFRLLITLMMIVYTGIPSPPLHTPHHYHYDTGLPWERHATS